MKLVVRAGSFAALAAGVTGCAVGAGAGEPIAQALDAQQVVAPTTIADWQRGLSRLSELRRAALAPRTQRIALTIHEPRSGRVISARGALALAPPEALRMILIGPGGTTALDLWLRGDRFQFEVPAIDLKRRGDLRGPRADRRGLPVDFLAWWLLRPASGKLLFQARQGAAHRFVLRDGDAVVDLRAWDDGRIEARRTSWSLEVPRRRIDDEIVEAQAGRCSTIRYRQVSTGLTVEVTCEGEALGRPAGRALSDPEGTP